MAGENIKYFIVVTGSILTGSILHEVIVEEVPVGNASSNNFRIACR